VTTLDSREKSMAIEGITEADIANYLSNHPGFFERHAELLSSIQMTSPHGGRAVSLHERQMEMLREKMKGLEKKIIQMIRNSQENAEIADRLNRWLETLLLTHAPSLLPTVLVTELMTQFMIPFGAIRIWDVADLYQEMTCAEPVSDDVKSFASSLSVPYCGLNSGFEAANWLQEPKAVTSVALVPLRLRERTHAFGLLVLGSPDPTRYSTDMGTEFLSMIGEMSSASLSRLVIREIN
jgi:uncharacterized protein